MTAKPQDEPALNQATGLRHRGPSTITTSPGAAINSPHAAEPKARTPLLVAWDDLPPWQQDNHFIRSGYRVGSNSYASCLASLFYVHNESVNIWSHLAGAVLFPLVGWHVYGLLASSASSPPPSSSADVLVFSCFLGGAALCLGFSAAFHALSSHSETIARWGNKLDYSGIVLLIVGSYVPALYYGLFCRPELMAGYMCAIFLLGLGCGVVSWIERFRTPRWRPYRALVFVGLGVSGIVPVCHGLSIYGYRGLDERMGLNWVLLQGLLYILGAFLYGVRWPERSFPGVFDIWGGSHQIFHVLILLAAASHLVGMSKAFDYRHTVIGAQC